MIELKNSPFFPTVYVCTCWSRSRDCSEGPGSLPQARQSGLGSDEIPQRAGVGPQCSLLRVGARSFQPDNEPN